LAFIIVGPVVMGGLIYVLQLLIGQKKYRKTPGDILVAWTFIDLLQNLVF
jgi:hypothetical protein